MKRCGTCKEEKSEEEFSWKNKSKGIRQTFCKPCKNKFNKKWYESHKEEQIARASKNSIAKRKEALQWKYDYLLEKKCCIEGCTNNNPLGLELDHLDRNTKEFNVSDMIRRGYSLDRIKAEAEKCRVICAYHHAIWTAEQMNYMMWRDNAYIEVEVFHASVPALPPKE